MFYDNELRKDDKFIDSLKISLSSYMKDFYIASSIAQNLMRFAQQRDINVSLFDPIDLSTAHIPFAAFAGLQEFVVEKSKDQVLGLHIGEQYNLAALGIVGQIISACRTIEAALKKCCDYFNLISNVFQLHMKLGARTFQLVLEMDATCARKFPIASQQLIFSSMSFAYKEVLFLIPKQYKAQMINFQCSKQYLSEFERIFESPIQFNASQNSLVFNREILNEKILYSDYELLLLLEQVACKRLAQQEENQSTFTNQITVIVYRMLDPYFPSIETVALNLNISARSLQRRLKAEKTSYSKITEKIKKELALEYLAKNLSVKEVSYLLGYAEPSVFVNAFRKWFGETPAKYKAKMRI